MMRNHVAIELGRAEVVQVVEEQWRGENLRMPCGKQPRDELYENQAASENRTLVRIRWGPMRQTAHLLIG
jgi:hypothetical protein